MLNDHSAIQLQQQSFGRLQIQDPQFNVTVFLTARTDQRPSTEINGREIVSYIRRTQVQNEQIAVPPRIKTLHDNRAVHSTQFVIEIARFDDSFSVEFR